ncbi:MAG: HAMP domain-containing sensor histidine kinase [Myxococcaceae bacterium]
MHPHCHPEPRGNPLGRYVRSRLRRRLFLWFGAAILLSALAFGLVMSLIGRVNEPWWRRGIERVQLHVGHEVARVWDQPLEREDLLRRMAADLDVDLRLEDLSGAVLHSVGERCAYPEFKAKVVRGGATLGTVSACLERHHSRHGWNLFLPLALAGAVLWAISGRVARRLTRPLSELASVVKEIGGGKLSARAPIPHGQDEVAVVAEAVNDMAARIEKQLGDQRELLAAVSHELRTPLSRIRLLIELARTGGATDQTFDDLDREVVEVDSLVGELLGSSRIDFAALSPRELSIADVAIRALERAGVEPTRLTVEAGPPKLSADATLLARALANLIENAKRHGGGLERLVVRFRPGFVSFEAEDKGPGIAEGDEARVFEPFRKRADGQERKDGSLGLGLALVQRIAQAHGGSAFARNRPGGGACVGLELPL